MKDIKPLDSWIKLDNQPLIIAGPCSAETEEQLVQTCKEIKKDSRVQMLRAGIWKPRTRPGTFEGVGEEALKWYQSVKKETGLAISCEVANTAHIEQALKYNVDVLWIGARTAVNPFAIQEIADALKGTDIPVMLKNPTHPDLELWAGGLERLYQAGLTKLAAIHRGFSIHEKVAYRNAPLWELPIELKRRIPNLPIIVDPSHICGKRDLIKHVCQKAFDLNFDGLMIETHMNPDKAWSDAAQQLTPDSLIKLLNDLELKSEASSDSDFDSKLGDLRSKIDRIDNELIEILNLRLEVSRAIGEEKKNKGVTALQVSRMDEMLQNRIASGSKLGLDSKYINDLFHVIHTESVRVQSHIVGDKK